MITTSTLNMIELIETFNTEHFRLIKKEHIARMSHNQIVLESTVKEYIIKLIKFIKEIYREMEKLLERIIEKLIYIVQKIILYSKHMVINQTGKFNEKIRIRIEKVIFDIEHLQVFENIESINDEINLINKEIKDKKIKIRNKNFFTDAIKRLKHIKQKYSLLLKRIESELKEIQNNTNTKTISILEKECELRVVHKSVSLIIKTIFKTIALIKKVI